MSRSASGVMSFYALVSHLQGWYFRTVRNGGAHASVVCIVCTVQCMILLLESKHNTSSYYAYSTLVVVVCICIHYYELLVVVLASIHIMLYA